MYYENLLFFKSPKDKSRAQQKMGTRLCKYFQGRASPAVHLGERCCHCAGSAGSGESETEHDILHVSFQQHDRSVTLCSR